MTSDPGSAIIMPNTFTPLHLHTALLANDCRTTTHDTTTTTNFGRKRGRIPGGHGAIWRHINRATSIGIVGNGLPAYWNIVAVKYRPNVLETDIVGLTRS